MPQARLSWRQKWQSLTRSEKALVVGSAVYVVLVAVYLFAWPATTLKYAAALLGFALLPLVPELIRKQHDWLLIPLIIGIALGNTVMQVKDDRDRGADIAALTNEVHKNRFEIWRNLDMEEATRKILASETVREDPIDAIQTLQHSPKGFESKAVRLSLRAMLEESRLLAGQPRLAQRVLRFPGEPKGRLAAYAEMRSDPAARGSIEAIDAVRSRLREELAYREAAKYLAENIVPKYRSLEKRIQGKTIDSTQVLAEARAIERQLDVRIAASPIAGLMNHAGVLAMAQGSPDAPGVAGRRALAKYYAALAADGEHVPVYESIAYASWSVNQEARTAIDYARRGMELVARYPDMLAAELDEIEKNYATVERAVPAASAGLRTQAGEASTRAGELKNAFTKSSTGMLARLRSLYAYCSALELQNEDEAREYARAIHQSAPDDPEYQDALGLVLLMFAKTPAELDEAERLFIRAELTLKSQQMTKKLVVMHRTKVDQKRRLLGLRK